MQHDEHAKVAGIVARNLSTQETRKRPTGGNRQESKAEQAISGAVNHAMQQNSRVTRPFSCAPTVSVEQRQSEARTGTEDIRTGASTNGSKAKAHDQGATGSAAVTKEVPSTTR